MKVIHDAENKMSRPEYRKPMATYISNSYERLYNLEHERNEIIEQCAVELSKIMGWDEKELWNKAIPQVLFDILDGWDWKVALLAAEAYIEEHARRQKEIDRFVAARSGKKEIG